MGISEEKMASKNSAAKMAGPQHSQHNDGGDGSISPGLAIISGLCVILLMVILAVASTSDRVSKPMNINGDSLGPETWESREAYRIRADQSLADIAEQSELLEGKQPLVEQPRFWGMVTFEHPVDVPAAAVVAHREPELRVASVILGGAIIRFLPQPSPTASEEELLQRQVQIAADYAGVPRDDDRLRINAFLVYGDADSLSDLREIDTVAAVEALPYGAARGRFGVRPVLGSDFTGTEQLTAPGLSQN